MGCVRGMFGYLPLYLREIGWTAASADGTLAAFHGASIVGAIPITLFSNRLRSRKVVLLTTTLMTAIGVGLLSITTGPMVLASVLMAGIVRDGFMAILLTMVMETGGVGATYSGTATGLVLTFSRIGNFASPPIGNSISSISPGLPFVFWAALVRKSVGDLPYLVLPFTFMWSPDDNSIPVTASTANSPEIQPADLYLMNLADGEVVKVGAAQDEYSVAWKPSPKWRLGKNMVFISWLQTPGQDTSP
jgi:hypothetical protein